MTARDKQQLLWLFGQSYVGGRLFVVHSNKLNWQ